MASTHTIPSGTRLGPYEIQSLIGRGGMGEVYRARDGRLGREVAIKVLPTSFAADADRVHRFEREARAAGQLNHPNVVAVHDVDLSTEVPYIVSELLHGTDLRKRIDEGPIPPRKAIAIGIQIAEGLAAAHAKGIAHRDLKPENVMLLGGDHVKILDFGLAKLVRGEPTPDSESTGALATQITATGAVLGTASYMAPEQIREQPTDQRADLFALGAILYEMVTGRRAFDGETPADRITAILHERAPEIPRAVEDAAPGLGTLVESCLEKNVEDRFQCAHDLAVALRQVEAAAAERRGDSGSVEAGGPEGAGALGTHRPTFHRTTYREGTVLGARFAPDGHAICYGGSWEGRPVELFWTFPGNPESRALGYPQTDVLAISASGEMAVSLRRHTLGGFIWSGMLARMPAGGGAPREILDGVYEADWSPDGRQLAIVREEAGFERIEFPIGKVLYKTPGWVSHMRVSPDGKHVAFIDHPHRGDDAGGPAWVDLEGNVKILSSDWSSARGLAWTPDGKEIVFTAFRSTGVARALYRTTLEGPERTVLEIPGHMTLQDVSRQGAALIVLENERSRAQFFGRNDAPARDLTWLDWTLVRAISADGGKVLFDETGIGGGALHSVYIRNTDGSPAIRLGDGMAADFSPDGQWALANVVGAASSQAVLLPCGAGEGRLIPSEGLEPDYAVFFPDGVTLCVMGHEPGHSNRLYRLDSVTGKYEAFSEEGITLFTVHLTPDGRFAAAFGPGRELMLYPTGGGEARPIPGVLPTERPIRFNADGTELFIFGRGELPTKVFRVNVATGDRKLLRELSPSNPTGVDGFTSVVMSADEQCIACSYAQRLNDLYVVEGLF